MDSYICIHNHKVPDNKPDETRINNCNCLNKDTCPLPNSCQTKCIVIDCDITGYKQKCYLSSFETIFKDRLGNHKKFFNHVNPIVHGGSEVALKHGGGGGGEI